MTSTQEQPISILPVPEPVKTEEVAATDAVLAGPGPVVPTKDENVAPVVQDEKTTTTIKETEAKKERKPLGILNNLFHRKASSPTAATAEEKPVKEEVAAPVKEETPVVEPVATETSPVTEEATPAEVESPKKKDGFLDKLKSFVGEKKEKVPKKSKEPEETKIEEAAPKAEEPVVEATEAKPAEAPIAAVVAPESTPAETPVEAPVAAATEETPKEVADGEVKKEEPAAKKDKAKIGRRLSARITGIFSSPRKEKTNPLEKTPTEEKKVEEALPAPVDLPKTEETTEPIVASTSEPLPAVEGPKFTEPVKAVEEVKPEESSGAAPTTTITAAVTEEAPKSDDRVPAVVS